MSRIGKQAITVPSGVEVTIDGSAVRVKGPKGQLEYRLVGDVAIERDGDALNVSRADDSRSNRSLHGLQRTLIANMVIGVSDGFSKELDIVGVGYRAAAQGPTAIELSVGYSHTVKFDAPEGITFEVPQPTRIVVRGHDKQLVGQVAADIRKVRKPEPYKGKGIRYVGEHVRRKAGKSAK
ncbi:MAG TPA: 50S ribosomal protein L6 [Acidimicrobiia bacterium]|jgi:large subunit ribosomal protein L6|nr:50S ribosomal protein L6 [Acidimicrobiia bacterium]